MVSCKKTQKLNINDIPEQTVHIKKESTIDSCNGINIFLFNKNIVVVVPQSSFGKYPYFLYEMDNLCFTGSAGQFGHSSQEFVDVNPYYIIKNDTSFAQCTDGYFESEYTITEGQLKLLRRNKISSFNMNGLCKIGDDSYVFRNEDPHYEFVYYSSKSKDYSKFSKYPTNMFPAHDQDDYFSFYEKVTSFNTADSVLYSFYTNIPLVRLFNKEGKELSTYIMETNGMEAEYYKNFIEDKNKIYYCLAKSYGQYTFALYHGTKFLTPYSEIHVWDNTGNMIKRIILQKWVKCFDVDFESKKLYGIYIDDDEHLFFTYFSL